MIRPDVLNDRRRTAIHEAGHAVIGRVVGMTCGDVTIEPDHNSAGHGIVADPWAILGHWEEREKFRDVRSAFVGRIITYLAGAAAERECLGASEGADADDLWQVALMLEQTGWPRRSGDQDADRNHYLERLQLRTAALVQRHRRTIENVADALMERDQLAASEIDAMIAESPPATAPRERRCRLGDALPVGAEAALGEFESGVFGIYNRGCKIEKPAKAETADNPRLRLAGLGGSIGRECRRKVFVGTVFEAA